LKVRPSNLFTKVYITATHNYFPKGICCHSIEFRLLRSSLMKLFQQFERWNLKLPIANGAINIRQHSYSVLCRLTVTLVSFNTRALEINLANRTLQINYCITIKNQSCILQRGTKTSEKLTHQIAAMCVNTQRLHFVLSVGQKHDTGFS
jgi:hypothetical protein